MKRASAVALAAALAACTGAYLTAPSGSTITLVANPPFIASHGGVSEIDAIVIEPAGTEVPDGTSVLWTTTLGHIDRETRTRNGIARNRLVADSRSGVARVTVVSGGEALPPSPTPSASPTTSPTTTLTTPTTTLLRGTAGGVAAGPAAVQNSAFIDITIGNVRVANVLLRANPPRITISNSTHVIATVLDSAGNPIPNVPVYFEVFTNRDVDFFESAGAPRFTDNNGEARDVLRTRRQFQGTIIVRAMAAGNGRFVQSNDLEIPVL